MIKVWMMFALLHFLPCAGFGLGFFSCGWFSLASSAAFKPVLDRSGRFGRLLWPFILQVRKTQRIAQCNVLLDLKLLGPKPTLPRSSLYIKYLLRMGSWFNGWSSVSLRLLCPCQRPFEGQSAQPAQQFSINLQWQIYVLLFLIPWVLWNLDTCQL